MTVVTLQAAHRLTFYRHVRSLKARHHLHMTATLYPFQSQMSHRTHRHVLLFLHYFNIIPFSPISIALSHQIFHQNFVCLSLTFLACCMYHLLHDPYLVALLIYATETNLQLMFLFPSWIKIYLLAAFLEIHQISVSK